MKKLFFAITAVVVAFSCAKEAQINNNEPINEPAKTVKVSFSASVDDTKATITGKAFTWSKDDKVAVYEANSGTFYEFALEGDGGSNTGTFSTTLAEGTYRFTKAYYPSTLVTLNTAGQNENTVTLGSEVAAANAASYIPLEGIVSGTSLEFNYMTAILAINVDRVPADATKAIIDPTTGISGSFTVYNNKIAANGTGETAVTFSAGSLSGAQTFYYAMPEGSNGFTFKFVNAANETLYSFATTSNKDFVAASYWNMAELTVPAYVYVSDNTDDTWNDVKVYIKTSSAQITSNWPGDALSGNAYTHNGHSYKRVELPAAQIGATGGEVTVSGTATGSSEGTRDYVRVGLYNQTFTSDKYYYVSKDTPSHYKTYLEDQSGSTYDLKIHIWGTTNSPATSWPGLSVSGLNDESLDGGLSTKRYIKTEAGNGFAWKISNNGNNESGNIEVSGDKNYIYYITVWNGGSEWWYNYSYTPCKMIVE